MGSGTQEKRGSNICLLLFLVGTLLLPTIFSRAGPRPTYTGQGGTVDHGVIEDIFGGSLGARYGDESSESGEDDDGEWIEVPITLLPGDGDCGPIQVPEEEPKMAQLHEEYTPIEVIKATNNNKCDFYTETEGYECVPYYQCDEGTIITDGYGLIDIRFGGVGDDQTPELAVLDSSDLMCPGSLDVCCKDPDFVKPTAAAPLQSTEDYGQQQEAEEVEVCAQVLCCGSDGVTYSTPCDVPSGVVCVSNNECPAPQEEEEEVCHYTQTVQHVCGTDGMTYMNREYAECEEAEVECEGECPCDAVVIEPYTREYVPKCGRRHSQGLGVKVQNYKDDEAQFGEWPHICAILRKEVVTVEPEPAGKGGYGDQQQQQQVEEQVLLVFQGGASLISAGVVMTGAHKVIDFVNSPGDLVVRCGEWDTQTEGEPLPHQERPVAKVVTHPEYNKRNLGHTIALLFLEADFILADHIDTICLPKYQEEFYSGEVDCFVKGWGKDVFGAEGQYQVVLKEVGLPMVPRQSCEILLRKTRLGKRFRLDASFVCAGGEEGRDACRGDGGGPLVCPVPGEPDRYAQVGVVAWGIGCGEKDVPGVYTSVAEEVCWIDYAMKCQLGDQHELMYGDECNAWLDGEVAPGKPTRRFVYSSMTTCPDVVWPVKEVDPEPYSIQTEEIKQTNLPEKIKTKTKSATKNVKAEPEKLKTVGGY